MKRAIPGGTPTAGRASPFRLVAGGMALAFFSLFLTWQAPEAYLSLDAKRVGSVTETRDETGRVLHRLDATRLRPEARTEFAPGQSGFEYAGPIVPLLVAGGFLLGVVGLRGGRPAGWAAAAGVVVLVVLGWNALVTLADAGPGIGSLLYLAGIALAGVGGVRGHAG